MPSIWTTKVGGLWSLAHKYCTLFMAHIADIGSKLIKGSIIKV